MHLVYFGVSSDLESVKIIVTVFLYIKQSVFLDLITKGRDSKKADLSEIPTKSQADALCSDFNSFLTGSVTLNKLLVLQTSVYKCTLIVSLVQDVYCGTPIS